MQIRIFEMTMRRQILFVMVVVLASVAFAADEENKWQRRDDLQSMQGKWQLVETKSVLVMDEVIKHYLPDYHEDLKVVCIEGNRMLVGSQRQTLTIANDLRFQQAKIRVMEGNHLISLTLKDGRAMLGSYKHQGDELEIRVPETCECTRSGIIAKFARMKE